MSRSSLDKLTEEKTKQNIGILEGNITNELILPHQHGRSRMHLTETETTQSLKIYAKGDVLKRRGKDEAVKHWDC